MTFRSPHVIQLVPSPCPFLRSMASVRKNMGAVRHRWPKPGCKRGSLEKPSKYTSFGFPWGKPNQKTAWLLGTPRSSSGEVRIRVPFFSVVYFSRGTLPQKRHGKRALLGDHDAKAWTLLKAQLRHAAQMPPRLAPQVHHPGRALAAAPRQVPSHLHLTGSLDVTPQPGVVLKTACE